MPPITSRLGLSQSVNALRLRSSLVWSRAFYIGEVELLFFGWGGEVLNFGGLTNQPGPTNSINQSIELEPIQSPPQPPTKIGQTIGQLIFSLQPFPNHIAHLTTNLSFPRTHLLKPNPIKSST